MAHSVLQRIFLGSEAFRIELAHPPLRWAISGDCACRVTLTGDSSECHLLTIGPILTQLLEVDRKSVLISK